MMDNYAQETESQNHKRTTKLVGQRLAGLLITLVLLGGGCGPRPAVETPLPPQSPIAAQPESSGMNLSGCADTYEAGKDYFPQKTAVQDAAGFSVTYHGNYKIVDVHQAGQQAVRYVLVQCGTPPPAGFSEKEIYSVPVRSILVMSTTYLPFLEQFGALEQIVGVDDPAFISNEVMRKRIAEGKVGVVGTGSGVNVEKALELQPDLVLAYQSGIPEYDAFPRLLQANLKVALAAEQAEASPLGRAEWGKFISLFLNKEDLAEKSYRETAKRYRDLAAEVAKISYAPSVFFNTPYEGTWYMAGGQSYLAQLAQDAGANYVWAGTGGVAPMTLSFEQVYEKAGRADFWILSGFTSRAEDLAREDERFRMFAAFQSGKMYNNNARVTEAGGNDYYESGAAHPDVILADLVKIFHPGLLPEHELFYFKQLEPESHAGG